MIFNWFSNHFASLLFFGLPEPFLGLHFLNRADWSVSTKIRFKFSNPLLDPSVRSRGPKRVSPGFFRRSDPDYGTMPRPACQPISNVA